MQLKVLQIRENKIAAFNYKFLNGITACGKLLNKWKHNISKNCQVCGSIETHYHIIYQCSLVHDIWTTLSDMTDLAIDLKSIAFGVNNRPLNNLISQISYSIHKYWIICVNEKKQASRNSLRELVKYDLLFKSKVMMYIGEGDISTLFQEFTDIL